MGIPFIFEILGGITLARIYPLFSSSKGNASFIGDKSGGVLIDSGVSFRRLMQALELCEIPPEAVMAVFITHSHSDHVKGLKMLTKRLSVPIWGRKETLDQLIHDELVSPGAQLNEMNGAVHAAGMEITCFNTPHDTAGSCGYRVSTADGRSCAVCTDLGCVTDEVEQGITGCNLVLLEANYDEKMLRSGPYPHYLKQRISSDKGHLSNRCCGLQAARLIENGTTRIILGHLSQENNTPKTAEKAVLEALSEYRRNSDYILNIAPVETTGEMAVF